MFPSFCVLKEFLRMKNQRMALMMKEYSFILNISDRIENFADAY